MGGPTKWRYRFGLRTMLLGVTVCAVPMGLLGQHFAWLQARREFRARHLGNEVRYCLRIEGHEAPGWLWVFGEYPAHGWYDVDESSPDYAEARRLFPEADWYD